VRRVPLWCTDLSTQHGFNGFPGDRAGAEDHRLRPGEVENGGLDSARRRSCVYDEIDVVSDRCNRFFR
jgi:hypothetical protein